MKEEHKNIEIIFYQLTITGLENSLPKLLEKVYENKNRAVVLLESIERLKNLNAILWTYSTMAFLPHGWAEYPTETHELQPIWLTTQLENPNSADILLVANNQYIEDFSGFKKCLDIFDGNFPDNKTLDRIERYKKLGHSVCLWRQSAKGAWEKVF